MTTASTKQLAVLKVIRRFVAERGYPPSYREIAAELNYSSTGSIWHHVTALERAGLLTRREARPRALTPEPTLDSEHGDGSVSYAALAEGGVIPLPAALLRPGDAWVVRMADDSLRHRQILRGDWLVTASGLPRSGDLVVRREGHGLKVHEAETPGTPAEVVQLMLRRI